MNDRKQRDNEVNNINILERMFFMFFEFEKEEHLIKMLRNCMEEFTRVEKEIFKVMNQFDETYQGVWFSGSVVRKRVERCKNLIDETLKKQKQCEHELECCRRMTKKEKKIYDCWLHEKYSFLSDCSLLDSYLEWTERMSDAFDPNRLGDFDPEEFDVEKERENIESLVKDLRTNIQEMKKIREDIVTTMKKMEELKNEASLEISYLQKEEARLNSEMESLVPKICRCEAILECHYKNYYKKMSDSEKNVCNCWFDEEELYRQVCLKYRLFEEMMEKDEYLVE